MTKNGLTIIKNDLAIAKWCLTPDKRVLYIVNRYFDLVNKRVKIVNGYL